MSERSELFNLVAEIATPPKQYESWELDAFGRPFPKPLYGTTGLSPDLELSALRTPQTLKERYYIAFGTAMPTEKTTTEESTTGEHHANTTGMAGTTQAGDRRI